MNDEMLTLLATTRQVNHALQERVLGDALDYKKLAAVLSEYAQSNVYIVDSEGIIKGHHWMKSYYSSALKRFIDEGTFPQSLTKKLRTLKETVEDRHFAHEYDDTEGNDDKVALIVPIQSGNERLGTLLLSRVGDDFPPKDLVLAEYLATLVGIEILNERTRHIEAESRERLVVQMAMGALSYSELESVRHIITDLGKEEGIVVASRIADRVGVTRSVIVNALRKLEGAGIIESRSLGMKGTHIAIRSPLFVKELKEKFHE